MVEVFLILCDHVSRPGAVRLVGEAYIHVIMKGEAMLAEDRVEIYVVIH
jgi:hypothetical protein